MTRSENTPGRPPLIVVGTPASAAGAAAQIRAMGSAAPRIAGVIIVGDALGLKEAAFGAPLLGTIEDLRDAIRRCGAPIAIVTLPAVMHAALAHVREILAAEGITERHLPTIADVLADTCTGVRGGPTTIDYAALVGRQPRALDTARIREMLAGRRVAITGAGGSIGAELARRCAALGVESLILIERAENALFEIDRQIAAAFPQLPRKAVLHDIVDADATLRRFVALRPHVVFHAAAHKHVPMMEDHPAAAVTNNLFGTKSVADAAVAVNAERFVMISTDKAVNPTSVMGATKRLAEVYVRSLNDAPQATTRCRFVRFGNVLGSACSVLPIWSAQIAEGGPITVTHEDTTRFFMTIPEAANLVIHAATLDDDDADALVLDMGEPIRIRDLAERFIRAHGLTPEWTKQKAGSQGRSRIDSIRVLFAGMRPGEKLHEELVYSAEELRTTAVPGVLAWSGDRPNPAVVTRMIDKMSSVRSSEASSVVLDALWNQLSALHEGALACRIPADAA